MYTSEPDKLIIQEIDKEEIDVQVQINFVAPKNVLNKNKFTLTSLTEGLGNDEEYQVNQGFLGQLKQIGEYDSVQVVKALYDELSKYDSEVMFSQEDLIYQNKLTLLFSKPTKFQTDDYYFQKVLGCGSEPLETDNEFMMYFPKKMFTGIARMLNVMCYFLTEPNYVQQGKKMFILLKTPYSFSPGQNRVIQSDTSPTFSTSQLQQGFAVSFCDENFVPLQLEGEDYYIDLFIQKSRRRVNLQQQLDDERQQQQYRQQQIQAYEQEQQKQREQYIQQEIKTLQEQQDQQFYEDEKKYKNYQKIKKQVQEMYNQMNYVLGAYMNLPKLSKEKWNELQKIKQEHNYQKERDQFVQEQQFEKERKAFYEWDKKQRQIILNADKNTNMQELNEFIKLYNEQKIKKQQLLMEKLPEVLDDMFNLIESTKERTLQFQDKMKEYLDTEKFGQRFVREQKQMIQRIVQLQNELNVNADNMISTQIFEDEKNQFNEYQDKERKIKFELFVDQEKQQLVLQKLSQIVDGVVKDEEIKQNIINEFKNDYTDEYVQNLKDQGYEFKDISDYLINRILFQYKVISQDEFLKYANVENRTGQKIIDVVDPLTQSMQRVIEETIQRQVETEFDEQLNDGEEYLDNVD